MLSKKIVGTLGPVRLQFYTSMLAIAFQLPVLAARAGALPSLATPTAFALPPLDPGLRHAVGLVALNVCSYHMQSVSASRGRVLFCPSSKRPMTRLTIRAWTERPRPP